MTDHRDELSPSYSWYPRDWRASHRVGKLSWKERGFYRECLDWAWDRNGLPNDVDEIRDLTGATKPDFKLLWPVIKQWFPPALDGRLRNPRQEVERSKQLMRKQRSSDGGNSKAQRVAEAEARALSTTSKHTQPAQPPGAAVSPALHLLVQEPVHLPVLVQEQGLNAPPTARSKRPIFTGQRLTVHEWMFDDCTKILGPNTDDFGLDQWFFDLDAMAVSQGLVIPKKDGGAWLQSQLVAEAQRRGIALRLAIAAGPGKQTSRLGSAVANIRASEGV